MFVIRGMRYLTLMFKGMAVLWTCGALRRIDVFFVVVGLHLRLIGCSRVKIRVSAWTRVRDGMPVPECGYGQDAHIATDGKNG